MKALADYVNDATWCQGVGADGEGRMCLIELVNKIFGDYSGAAYIVKRQLRDIIGGSIIEWNDTPGRTAKEVAELCATAGI